MKSVFLTVCFLACFFHGTSGFSSKLPDLLAAILSAFQANTNEDTTTAASATTTTMAATTHPAISLLGITIKPFTGPAMQLMPGDDMTVVVNCRRFCRKRRNGNYRIPKCNNRRDQNLCIFCRITLDCLSQGTSIFS